MVLIEEIEVSPNLTFEEELVLILEYEVKVLRKKWIPLVKYLWWNHGIEEATWKSEDSICKNIPIYSDQENFRTKFIF